MKNTIKLLGLIALAAVIGFGAAACSDGGGGGGGDSLDDYIGRWFASSFGFDLYFDCDGSSTIVEYISVLGDPWEYYVTVSIYRNGDKVYGVVTHQGPNMQAQMTPVGTEWTGTIVSPTEIVMNFEMYGMPYMTITFNN